MTHQAETIADVAAARDDVVNEVATEGRAVIRGLFDRDALRAAIPRVYERANRGERLASAGVSPDAIRRNVVKWSIGGESASQSGLPRMMVTVYNPLFAEDIFKLHAVFRRLIEVRDTLARRDVLTDEKLAPSGWNGCRIQIYPAGGGFMGSHQDSRAVQNLDSVGQNKDAFIQLVLLLTEKGTDYDVGGAVNVVSGTSVDVEEGTLSADVLVYDGSTMHGVADIDPTKPFRADDLRGRAVLLTTVYN